MKFIQSDTLKPTDTADVIDYPISEAFKDAAGKPVWDANMGDWRPTGRTLEFTLRRGEAAEFEDYVADILLDRFSFLEEKKQTTKPVLSAIPTDTPIVEEPKAVEMPVQDENAAVKVAGSIICPECGKGVTTNVQLGMHMGSRHPSALGGQTVKSTI